MTFVRQKQQTLQQKQQLFLEQALTYQRRQTLQQTIQRWQLLQEQQFNSFCNVTEKHVHRSFAQAFHQSTFVRQKRQQIVRQQAPLMPLEQFTYVRKVVNQRITRPVYILPECRCC
jgi:hypothetical protein